MPIKNIINLIKSNKNYKLHLKEIKSDFYKDVPSKNYITVWDKNNNDKLKAIFPQSEFWKLFFEMKENKDYTLVHKEIHELNNEWLFESVELENSLYKKIYN